MLLVLYCGAAAAKRGHEDGMVRFMLLRIASDRQFVAATANSCCLRQLASQACGLGNTARDRVRCERHLHFPALYGSVPAQFGMLADAVAGQAEPRHQTRSQLSADNSCFKSAYARKARNRVCKCNWERPSRTRQTGGCPLAILILMLILSHGAKRRKSCSCLFCSC